jgi:hypothetical protein
MSRQFFAQLDENNVVIDVHCVTAEFMAENPDRYQGVWVETFFDTNNKTYAGVGFIYNEQTKDFTQPIQPSEPIDE